MSHGRIVTTIAINPVLIAVRARLFFRFNWTQSQLPINGTIPIITGLVNAAKPRSTPRPAHALRRFEDASERTSRKITASSSATKEWYHIVVADKSIAYGKKAHTQAATLAVRTSKVCRAMRKMGTEVTAEKSVLMARNTSAEALVYTPKVVKMPAKK